MPPVATGRLSGRAWPVRRLGQFDGDTQFDVQDEILEARIIGVLAARLELRLELSQLRYRHHTAQQSSLQPVQPIKQIVTAPDLTLPALGCIFVGLQRHQRIHWHGGADAGHAGAFATCP